MENNTQSFEEKIQNAKKILDKLMQQDITLEESLKAYEEGISQLKEASKMLEEAKLKITQIQQS